MAEKYGEGGGGDTTSNAEVIDLSCMQVVKSRRRSVPVKYVPPPKPAAAGEGGAATKRSKSTTSITFTQQEVINVTPSCSTPVGKTPRNTTNTTTTISLGLDDSSSSRPIKISSRTAAKLSKEEYHYQLDELHTSLLQGDAELADLLCCLVHTTMNGSPCLTPTVPLPKLPTHSYPVFHFDKNRVPFFILFREDFVSTCAEELRSPAELLKDVDEEMLQKSRSIYEFLLKHQARQRRRQHFANIEGQITLLRLYYRTLLQDERALEEARQSLQTRYENDWPNPRIFDVLVQVDEHTYPLIYRSFLTNYDPTILSYSKSIYELIYQEHLSSTSSETVSNM
ncbi:hypothetical protein TYRP_011741 [Tyrophagus putrescentiae]|nr:hypothetical protein TYRP_011741 [Tyrophagus putrescentiae]